jgi:hypothetical protein
MVQCPDEVYNCRTYDEAKQQLNRLKVGLRGVGWIQ